ncbi:hypothetical protein [Hymenobacter terrestris]|uniref:Uncharacterized protein n=1 Tax=Hymenobacter terrestris TaxID=2748310 RepID=A0ABX2Q6U5_9BACT|nr:hypothetical protein [Hymenobacter terrestris]NVO85952.1 hypothetical protein [Hymenobacter terrestris]
MLIGLNKRIQFRPGQEQEILRELAATGLLAPNVARRLRGKFKVTKGAASDYNPLLAEGIAPASVPSIAKNAQVPAAPPTIAPPQSDTTQVQVAVLPQQPGTSTTPALAQEMAYSDTLRAISRLFERRRRGGGAWVGGGLSSVLTLALSLSSPNSDAGSVSAGGIAALVGLFVAAPVAIGSVNLAAYKKEREEEVTRAYQAGQPLPKKIRSRLKKKDLQPYD